MMNQLKTTSLQTLLMLACTLLAACGGESENVRDSLGISRAAPDAFKVVSRPPLSVPPEFRLVQPTPGALPRGVVPARDRAAALLLSDGEQDGAQVDAALAGSGINLDLNVRGLEQYSPQADTTVTPVVESSLESAAEAHFLGRAGAEMADESIRQRLASGEDEAAATKSSQYGLEQWLGLDASENVLDPAAEAERIRGNIDKDKPINEGKVETLKTTPSVLDKIF